MDTKAEVPRSRALTCDLLGLKENLFPEMLLNDPLVSNVVCATLVFSEAASLHIYQDLSYPV